MTSYFASIIPIREGGYVCFVFDFPEAVTQGDDLEDAVLMVEDVLAIWGEDYTCGKKELPTPSTLELIKEHTLAKIAEDVEYFASPCEPFYQLLKMPSMVTKPVRVSVSFPQNVLEFIDKEASKLGMTRSGFLAKSALSYVEQ